VALVVQLVLIVLAIFSITSWALILYKWRELRRAQQDSEAFVEVYHDGSFDAAYEAAPFVHVVPEPPRSDAEILGTDRSAENHWTSPCECRKTVLKAHGEPFRVAIRHCADGGRFEARVVGVRYRRLAR